MNVLSFNLTPKLTKGQKAMRQKQKLSITAINLFSWFCPQSDISNEIHRTRRCSSICCSLESKTGSVRLSRCDFLTPLRVESVIKKKRKLNSTHSLHLDLNQLSCSFNCGCEGGAEKNLWGAVYNHTQKGVIRRNLAEQINPPPSLPRTVNRDWSLHILFSFPTSSRSSESSQRANLMGYFSPGSRPRWKMSGIMACSFCSWVVTPGTSCPGQKLTPWKTEKQRKRLTNALFPFSHQWCTYTFHFKFTEK